MATVLVKCPYCGSTEVICHGKSRTNVQRYKCKQCNKTFQLEYKNKACKTGIHEQIVKMSMNSSGTRDTARVLGISKNTVSKVLKKNINIVLCVNAEYIEKNSIDVDLLELYRDLGWDEVKINRFKDEFTKRSLEMDEMWSYSHDKKQQEWLWWAVDHETHIPVAFCFGPRKHEVLDKLLKLIEGMNIRQL